MGETSYGKCRYLSVNWEFSKIKLRNYTWNYRLISVLSYLNKTGF